MDDRERIFDFIEQDDPRAAVAVDERIATQVLVLSQFPEGGRPGRIEGTRELIVRRTSWPTRLERIAFASCEFCTAPSCGPAS